MNLKSFLPSFLDASIDAAISSYEWVGRGDKIAADDVATNAMRERLKKSKINATVVVGEGEMDKAPMLFNGEKFGENNLDVEKIDIAVDPLEGTNLCATGANGAMTVIAFAKENAILRCPDIYMEKLVVSPGYEIHVDMKNSFEENLVNLCAAKRCKLSELKVILLNRPRHESLIKKARQLGCKITLISDGDISAVLSVLLESQDIYVGSGGAPEGILSAIAAKTLNGDIQGRLLFSNDEEKEVGKKYGIINFDKIYRANDMVKGESYLIASGVTNGEVCDGVVSDDHAYEVESLIFSSKDKEMQTINTMRLK
jgi:fructose-1,6-bisphosphatase II